MNKQMMNMDELEQVNGGFVDELADNVYFEKFLDGVDWVYEKVETVKDKIMEYTNDIVDTVVSFL